MLPTMPRVPVVFVDRPGRMTVHRRPLAASGEDDATRSSPAEAPEAPYESDEREAEALGLRRPPTTSSTRSLMGFVGNRSAVEALSIQLRYVEQTGTSTIRSVGLFGSKSTGKTEISRRLADRIGRALSPA